MDDFIRHRFIVKYDPLQADEIRDAHKAVGQDFRVDIRHFLRILGCLDSEYIALGKLLVIVPEQCIVDKLGFPDDFVETAVFLDKSKKVRKPRNS